MNVRTIFALAIACCATPGVAHAFLQHGNPGAGVTLNAPPTRVVLIFSEKLAAQGSRVSVIDAIGRSVEAGAAVVDGKTMVAPLLPLGPGKYRVIWHAMSLDEHRTQGAYSFCVKP